MPKSKRYQGTTVSLGVYFLVWSVIIDSYPGVIKIPSINIFRNVWVSRWVISLVLFLDSVQDSLGLGNAVKCI